MKRRLCDSTIESRSSPLTGGTSRSCRGGRSTRCMTSCASICRFPRPPVRICCASRRRRPVRCHREPDGRACRGVRPRRTRTRPQAPARTPPPASRPCRVHGLSPTMSPKSRRARRARDPAGRAPRRCRSAGRPARGRRWAGVAVSSGGGRARRGPSRTVRRARSRADSSAWTSPPARSRRWPKQSDGVQASGDGRTLVVRTDTKLNVQPADRPRKQDDDDPPVRFEIDLERIRITVDPADEWVQMYEEAARLMRRHFWVEDMAGVDWEAVVARYRPLADRVATRDELHDLIWELHGELGTSHAYVRADPAEVPPIRADGAPRRRPPPRRRRSVADHRPADGRAVSAGVSQPPRAGRRPGRRRRGIHRRPPRRPGHRAGTAPASAAAARWSRSVCAPRQANAAPRP